MCLSKGFGYPGKVIFTEEMAEGEDMDDGSGKRNFNLLDNIFAKVILDETLSQTYDEMGLSYNYNDAAMYFNYALRFYINGEQKDTWLFEMPSEDFENTKKLNYILSTSDEAEKRRFSYTVNSWVDLISPLDPGTYEIKMEFIPLTVYKMDRDMPVLAKGSIRLKVTDDMEAFEYGKSTGLPEPTLMNEKLEQMVIRASDGLYSTLGPVDAIITDLKGDWTYGVDDLGNILRRYIVATVCYKNSLNGECELKSGVYFQAHRGNGIFDKMFYLKPAKGYYDYTLACEQYDRAQQGFPNRVK
jgi:hypothetical protein